MYLRTLSGVVAGIASVALATSALAAPAHAAEQRPQITRADVSEFIAANGTGKITPADADTDELFASLTLISDSLCSVGGHPADSSLVLFDFAEAPGVLSLGVSADVNTDDSPEPDETCTFALLFADEGSTFTGRYTFDVTSNGDPTTRRTGTLSEDLSVTSPVFTDIDWYANASLTASGKTLTPTSGWVNTKVTKAKTAKQKKAAKKKYQAAVKSAKKKYAKAGKTKKAKKDMTKRIARAKRAYKKAIAPSTKTVRQLKKYTASKPFTLSMQLDDADDIQR